MQKSLKSIENSSPSPEKTFILLNKKEYFNKIVGNSKDFFFFIVFQEENSEILNEAQQIASVLRKSINKYTPNSNIIIYLIERVVYRDIKVTINRVKNNEIYEKDSRNNAIEIYFKTPYSGNQAYLKYKQGSFYNERGQKKIFKLIKKLIDPVEIINDQETLLNKLQLQSLNKINSPLIITAMPESANEKTINKLKKKAFFFFERKLLPLNSNFVIVNKPNLMNKFDMLNNETYIFRNDFFSKYYQTICPWKSEDEDHFLKIKNNGNLIIESAKNVKYCLEKYSIFKENEKTLMQETKDEKTKERNCFLSFISPRVFHLSDTKTKSLAPFFKKINLNKKKPVISFFLTQEDLENKERFENFEKLYKLYRENFHFVVMDSGQIEEVFPHANKHYPRFCIFNFFNQNKNNLIYKNYYKSLIFPFEKYFLKDEGCFFERFEDLREKIEFFLKNKANVDYISKNDELVDDINADVFNKNFEKNQNFVVELYDQSIESEFSRQIFNKIYEEIHGENMKFFRMNCLNDSPYLINMDRFPAYIYWDSMKKKMYVYHPNFIEIGFRKGNLEEDLRTFIFNKNNKNEN